MPPAYQLQEGGSVTGPHSLLVLRQKAEIYALGPDTLIRPAGLPDAPWTPLREHAELHAELFPARATPRLNLAAAPTRTTSSDAALPATHVHALLRENAARQIAAENAVGDRELRPPGSARRRDFWLVLIGGNGLAAGLGAWLGFNAVTGVFILSFCALFTVGIYWVLFHVMDPY